MTRGPASIAPKIALTCAAFAVFAIPANAAATASKTRELCAKHSGLTKTFRDSARNMGWRAAREKETKAIKAVVADGAMITIPDSPKRKIRWEDQQTKARQMAAVAAQGVKKKAANALVLVTGRKPLSVLIVYTQTQKKPAFLHCLYSGQMDAKFVEFITAVSAMDKQTSKKRNWPYQLITSNAKNPNPERPALVDLQAARYLPEVEAELGRKPWAEGGFSQVSYAHD